ncbi:MAG TPA: signal peptidase II [Lachnospiraceae bacterium]|nr:signal peptidase II [Lachnospiraceae bacterium]
MRSCWQQSMKFISVKRMLMRENKGKKRLLIMDAAIMLVLLLLDQFTKYLALTRLKGNPAIVLIDGILELQYVENTGMAFSLFQDRKVFILIMGFLVMAVILFFLFRIPEGKRFRIVHVLLAALIAGALGNIIDRIRFDFVVDFISFVLIHYPVFNVADCYIVVSAILLFILFMFVYREEELEFLSFRKKRAAE